jgi:8-oxo-dGTP diphosphatase
MSLAGKWEFPGGKLEPGESASSCIQREIFEELNINIRIKSGLQPVSHQYPAFQITLFPFVCAIRKGQIALREHQAMLWLSPEEFYSLDWAEADIPVLRAYHSFLKRMP